MNERIRELAVQAVHPYELTYGQEKIMEMFAELIVRECMEQVWYTREDKIDETISQNIKARMATHFGVEE